MKWWHKLFGHTVEFVEAEIDCITGSTPGLFMWSYCSCGERREKSQEFASRDVLAKELVKVRLTWTEPFIAVGDR